MSFVKTLKQRAFRRLSESDMITASQRYQTLESHTNDNNDNNDNDNNDGLHSNFESSTPATKRRVDNESKNKRNKSGELKAVLSLLDLVVFGLCQVIGSGIYVLAGSAGKYYAGSGLFISFIIGAISAGASAICYAEFASRIPVIGGSYMYTYYSSGEMIGFLSGFLTFLRGFFALAGNAVGWTGYFKSLLGSFDSDVDKLSNDGQWTSYLFGHSVTTNSEIITSINLLAPIIVFLLSLISAYGIKTSANFMNIIAVWNVSLIFFFILSGLFLFDINIFLNPCDYSLEFDNIQCDDDVNKDAFLPYGIFGVFSASGLAFWSYVGLEGIASVAEEAINPKTDVPRAIYIVLFIVAILYISVAIILCGLVPFQALDEDAPLAQAFGVHDEKLLLQVASIGAVTTITVVIFATLINRPRSLYRMSIDGLLCCGYVNSITQTPLTAIFITAFLAMIVSAFFNITDILQVASVTALLQYAVVAGGTLIIRYSPPTPRKTFNQNKYLKRQQKPIKYDYNESMDQSLGQSLDDNGSLETWSSKHLAPSLVIVTSFWTFNKVFIVIWSWIIGCLFISFVIVERDEMINFSKTIWYGCLCIAGTLIISSALIIIYMHYTIPWRSYVDKKKRKKIVWTPLCPYLPMFAVAINSFIIASYRFYVFIRIFVALAIGFIVYFVYGIKHSKLNMKKDNISSLLYGSIDDNNNNNNNYDDDNYFSQPKPFDNSIRSVEVDQVGYDELENVYTYNKVSNYY